MTADPAAAASGARLVVYTRAGCHLCEDAERLVGELADRYGTAVEHVDVDSTPELVEAYGVRVPVVAVDGKEVAELLVDRATVAAALDRG